MRQKKTKATVLHAGIVEELHTAGVNFQNQMEENCSATDQPGFRVSDACHFTQRVIRPSSPAFAHHQSAAKIKKTTPNGLVAVRHLVGSPKKPPERKQTNHKTLLFNGDYCRF